MEKGETKSEIIQENMGALNGRKNSSSMVKEREKKKRRRKERKERKRIERERGNVIENVLDDESSHKRIKSNKDFLFSVIEEKQKR